MTAHPPELWEQAKAEYLAGKPIAEIARITGLAMGSITGKAKLSGWTETKLQAKQEAELNGLRPKLHSKLGSIIDSKPLQKPPRSIVGAQNQADLLLTLTNAAEKVEGWAPAQGNTLVNVSILSQCVSSAPVQASTIQEPCQDAEVVSEEKEIPCSEPALPEEGG